MSVSVLMWRIDSSLNLASCKSGEDAVTVFKIDRVASMLATISFCVSCVILFREFNNNILIIAVMVNQTMFNIFFILFRSKENSINEFFVQVDVVGDHK